MEKHLYSLKPMIPNQKQHIINGTYPKEVDMVKEIDAVADVLMRHGVTVYRPTVIQNYNQIFSRDIAFVIGEQRCLKRIFYLIGIKHMINHVTSKLYKRFILEPLRSVMLKVAM